MASLAQLQTWLSEAEAARHALAMGQTTVEIGRDGRKVVYSKASLSDLESYIKWLNAEIEKAENADAGRPRRSAIGTVWKD